MPCLQEEITSTVGYILQHYVAELEATKKVFNSLSVNCKHHVKIGASILLGIIVIYSVYFTNLLPILNLSYFCFPVTENVLVGGQYNMHNCSWRQICHHNFTLWTKIFSVIPSSIKFKEACSLLAVYIACMYYLDFY